MQNKPPKSIFSGHGTQDGRSHQGWISSIGQALQENYMKQVSRYPTLTQEEESKLTKEYGEAKFALAAELRKYPTIFISIFKNIYDDDSSCRISNYFMLDENENDDENNVRQQFMLTAARIFSRNMDDDMRYGKSAKWKPEAFWTALEPLKPRHFLFKKACAMLEDEEWRKNVLTTGEWKKCKDIITDSQNTMTRVANILVERNLRLVISIAGHYMNCGIQLQDLVQEGNIGLMSAIERFDHTLGHRFSTYASYWIKQAITRNITNHSRIIRMPANTVSLISQIRQIERQILNETGEIPGPDIIAGRLEISTAKVRALQEMTQQPISLHSIVNEDRSLMDTIADQNSTRPSDSTYLENLKETVSKLLDVLTERERKIICMHFGINGEEQQTLTTISREMGLSRERVRQLEVRALHKLRMPSVLKILEGYS